MSRCGAVCRCWTSARRSSHHHADPWLEAAGCDSRPMMPPQRRGTSADLLAHVQHLHQQGQPSAFRAIPSLRSRRIASACDRHIEEWWRKRQHVRRSTKVTFAQDGQRPGERRGMAALLCLRGVCNFHAQAFSPRKSPFPSAQALWTMLSSASHENWTRHPSLSQVLQQRWSRVSDG